MRGGTGASSARSENEASFGQNKMLKSGTGCPRIVPLLPFLGSKVSGQPQQVRVLRHGNAGRRRADLRNLRPLTGRSR
jgi:hypothetical protein